MNDDLVVIFAIGHFNISSYKKRKSKYNLRWLKLTNQRYSKSSYIATEARYNVFRICDTMYSEYLDKMY